MSRHPVENLEQHPHRDGSEKQEVLVRRAHFDALRSQINPHFLFNTLNSIPATVRTDPVKARQIVLKLSNILHRLLHTGDDLVPLRDELAFIDAYLDIELVRFGPDKLRIERQIDAQTLDVMVPSMFLQRSYESPNHESPLNFYVYPYYYCRCRAVST